MKKIMLMTVLSVFCPILGGDQQEALKKVFSLSNGCTFERVEERKGDVRIVTMTVRGSSEKKLVTTGLGGVIGGGVGYLIGACIRSNADDPDDEVVVSAAKACTVLGSAIGCAIGYWRGSPSDTVPPEIADLLKPDTSRTVQ